MLLLSIFVIGVLCLTAWGFWDMRNVILTPDEPQAFK